MIAFQVDLVEATWKGGGRFRFDSSKLGLAQVGSSIALDAIVLCFPLPVISTLRLERKKKWSIGFIFWLGSLCVVVASIRLVLLHQVLRKTYDTRLNITDSHWPSLHRQIMLSYRLEAVVLSSQHPLSPVIKPQAD